MEGDFSGGPGKNPKRSVQESRKLDVCSYGMCRRSDTKSELLHSTCQFFLFRLRQARSRMCFVIEKVTGNSCREVERNVGFCRFGMVLMKVKNDWYYLRLKL